MVISAISAKSSLEVLRFSLDWAVDTLKALNASLRSAAFTRLVGIVELGTAGLGTAGLGGGLGTTGGAGVTAAAGGGLDCLEIFDIYVY